MIALKTSLYQHQQEAVKKLLSSKVGALFMEMGTGKSRTALELIALRQAKISNIVWFCPFSIKWALAEELQKHLADPDDLIHVFSDKTKLGDIPVEKLHIVGIESVSGSPNTVFCLHKIISENSYIIVDESFYIKNPSAKRTIWISELTRNCRYKLVLTGTPIAHSVIDLYSQIKFLSWKIFGYHSYYAFSKNHVEIIEEDWGYSKNARNTEYLAAKIEPYVYQVTKEECLDLPDKVYQPHYFEMSFEQREAYKLAKDELLYSLEMDDFKYNNILRLFTVLQQVVCGFRNYEHKVERFKNNRLAVLADMLNYTPKDKKIIIFCI
jgi:SNF2 family DNA or RNA helicase